jgi:hypothetical protein
MLASYLRNASANYTSQGHKRMRGMEASVAKRPSASTSIVAASSMEAKMEKDGGGRSTRNGPIEEESRKWRKQEDETRQDERKPMRR